MEKRNRLVGFFLIFVGLLVACGNSEDPVTKPKLTTPAQDEPTVELMRHLTSQQLELNRSSLHSGSRARLLTCNGIGDPSLQAHHPL